MQPAPLHIRVDHREASARTPSLLDALDGVSIEFARLPVGDYAVGERLVFERKTLTDFATSVQDGRLFRQAQALAGLPTPLRGALILEGRSTDLARTAMHRESLQGALITVTLFYGIPVLRSMDAEETARLMLYAARQVERFETHAFPRRGKRPKGKRKAQLALLQDLPGIGPDKAERLLHAFGCVEAVVRASVKELTGVPGIGKSIARNLRSLVGPEP